MHLGVNIYPNNATNKNVAYSIVEGKEYAEINFVGTVAVDRNLPAGDLSVTVRATSVSDPNVYTERTFTLYKPVIGISSANTDLEFVEQKRSYSFMANAEPYNATFGNSPVTYSLNVDESIATISKDGLLYITDKAPIGQSITVHIEATDEIFYEQTVTVVPVYAAGFAVKNYTAPNEGIYYLPNSVIDFDVEFFGADNISECNKKYFIEISDDSLAYMEGNSIVIRSIEEINTYNPSFSITLSTIQDGVLMSEVIDILIYIPVTSIAITQWTEWVVENTTYSFDELFQVEIYPANSTVRSATYEIILNNDVVYLDGNNLKVIQNVPLGNMKVQLRVKAYDQEKDIIFNVYKPAESLDIFASSSEPISAKSYGEKVILTSTTDERASVNNPTFTILKGANNIQGNYKDGEQLFDAEFELKSNLAYQANFNPIIIIGAEQDGVNTTIELTVYIPNEDIVLSTPGGLLTRGVLNNFSVSNTPNASEYGFKIITESNSCIEKIDERNKTIKLYPNVSACPLIT
ncbi:MAG: hypothetical protein K2I67_01915, partial [Malacoplasma sp.]|nr:hypothetical protein [Malacoplasma sp.]